MRLFVSSVAPLVGLTALVVVVPPHFCRAFVVQQPQRLLSSSTSTRIAYSYTYSPYDHNPKAYEDDGGLAAYEKALRAAYGQQQQQPSSSYQLPQEADNEYNQQNNMPAAVVAEAGSNNNNNDWVAQQTEAFLAVHEDEEIVVRDHPRPELVQEDVQVLPKAPVVVAAAVADTVMDTSSIIQVENDIADDFIALKNDIERYIFAETSAAAAAAAASSSLWTASSSSSLSNKENDEMMIDQIEETAAVTTANVAAITSPSMPTIQQVETSWGLPLQSHQPDEPAAAVAYNPLQQQQTTMSSTTSSMVNSALEQFAQAIDTPLVEQEEEAVEPNWLDTAKSVADINDYHNEPMVQIKDVLPTLEEPAVVDANVDNTDRAIMVEQAVAEPVLTMAMEQETVDMNLGDVAIESWPAAIIGEQTMDDSVTIVENAAAEAVVTPESLKEVEPITAKMYQHEEVSVAPLLTNEIPQEKDEQPIIITEETPVDLSFAFSPPDQVKDQLGWDQDGSDSAVMANESIDNVLPEVHLQEDDLNELVAAIEEFEKSDDAEVFLAALEGNPFVDEPVVSRIEEEDNVVEPMVHEPIKKTETARIVDVSSTAAGRETVQALQATTRSPAHQEDVEPPAVIKFLGNLLTKDLPEHAKKLPEDLKPLANVAGNIWTKTFGKWAESLTHTVAEAKERNDPPSEVFYFNLNTQRGDWDPSADDVTKSQMISKEQGKAWTATIDSRGNFFVHYYDKEDDVPAPQLIATDKTWDKYSTGSGRVYFVNRESGHSQWEEPTGFGLDEQAVHSLNKEIMDRLFARKETCPVEVDTPEYESDSSGVDFGGKQHRNGGSPVGFNLPSFFEKIAAHSKKATAKETLLVKEKVHFEPKPPKEDPWWITSADYDPKKLRP